jgi:hypothetical protein
MYRYARLTFIRTKDDDATDVSNLRNDGQYAVTITDHSDHSSYTCMFMMS